MKFFFIISLLVYTSLVTSSPDSSFYIFLCFGQSNMEGAGIIEEQDKTVDERFQMMAAVDMPDQNRIKYNWYKATPPLCYKKLTPADYFGRFLVEKLPKQIKIGVINVSVSSASIDLFDEEKKDAFIKSYQVDWFIERMETYNYNPYRVLINAAKEAQKVGIIKGILLHQGESDSSKKDWPQSVKKIYENYLRELNLKAENVPLLVGELVSTEMGGKHGAFNSVIDKINETIPTAFTVSSEGLEHRGDNLHFSNEGFRIFGKRYGEIMYNIIKEEMDKETKQKEIEESKRSRKIALTVIIIIIVFIVLGTIAFLVYRRFKKTTYNTGGSLDYLLKV